MPGPIINDDTTKTTEKKLTIDPITRLEGHGKIEIFLNEQGNVARAYWQVPELRGFERFCIGRHVQELPIITNRLCGVCPAAHHIASTKALDAVFNATPTPTASKLRELFYMGQYTHSHIAHFYALAAPDFVLGPSAPANKRNVLGVVDAVGVEIGGEVIKHRSYGQKVQEIVGGRATHPCFGLPGGVSKQISEEERAQMEAMARSCVEFGKFTVKLFHDVVLGNQDYLNLVLNQDAYYLETYYMGMVNKDNKSALYDGDVRVVDQTGKEVVKFKPSEYLDVISEHVEPWSYMKFPYLKNVGWKGFVTGPSSGIYRVGPLGRINVCEGYTTPLAQAEYEVWKKTFKDLGVAGPVHHTLPFHWARVIELLHAGERMLELATDPDITSDDTRGEVNEPTEGVGITEAPRGTLIHHYASDKNGLCTMINMIVATTNNNAAINASVNQAAQALIQDGQVSQGLLNKVEMAFRCYDPCNSCGTHALNGSPALEITVRRADGSTLEKQRNF
jgi:F420-non-reducing hydrogenase large subunit